MAGLFPFSRRRPARPRDLAPPIRPDRPMAIIGDLHGRSDLLDAMLDRIAARNRDALVVVVGDMIDRGPDSAGVLRRLHARSLDFPDGCICLMGNHERMLLDFLQDPARNGPRWLGHGGADTAASFDLMPWTQGAGAGSGARLETLAADLRAAMGADLLAWLAALPLSWHEGTLAVTHAGADPARDIAAQKPDSLLWGHRAFLRRPRRDDIWVVYGHRIVETAAADAARIAVDTGAWRSGRLSAAWIDGAGVSFIEVSDQKAHNA